MLDARDSHPTDRLVPIPEADRAVLQDMARRWKMDPALKPCGEALHAWLGGSLGFEEPTQASRGAARSSRPPPGFDFTDTTPSVFVLTETLSQVLYEHGRPVEVMRGAGGGDAPDCSGPAAAGRARKQAPPRAPLLRLVQGGKRAEAATPPSGEPVAAAGPPSGLAALYPLVYVAVGIALTWTAMALLN